MNEETRTFHELGISFPLFAAPAKFAVGYAGEVACDLCHQTELGFVLWIGSYIWDTCSRCGARNGLPADGDSTHATCHECRNLLTVPKFAGGRPKACYRCVRDGKVCFTHDTPFGMISCEQVLVGVTHGVPRVALQRLDLAGYETVPLQDDWVGVRISPEWMQELSRTPECSTIQSEQWQFCCQRAMVYVGEWSKSDFIAHAPDGDGKSFFDSIVLETEDDLWDDMWSGNMHDEFAIYVYHCPECGSYRAHWDMF